MRDRQPSAARAGASRFGAGRAALHAYAVFVTVSVLALICSGGLVTSTGTGLAVPDWPTTYGYNMFAFPISRWVGGVLYEHSHRLIASGIGMLTLGLAIALWRVDPRAWMRRLGVAALVAVMLQALLGGLRVIALKDQIGIFHACLAQSFFLLIAFIALATSRWWASTAVQSPGAAGLARGFAVAAGLIFVQLAIGATMRHAHAGLAIPDFPAAYGRVWPPLDAASVAQINEARVHASPALPVTSASQIVLQMLHRAGAAVISVAVLVAVAAAWRRRDEIPAGLRNLALLGPGLIALQVAAGIYTIWTNKAADVATTHVALGALSFAWAGLTAAAFLRAGRVGRVGAGAAVAPVRRWVEAGV